MIVWLLCRLAHRRMAHIVLVELGAGYLEVAFRLICWPILIPLLALQLLNLLLLGIHEVEEHRGNGAEDGAHKMHRPPVVI